MVGYWNAVIRTRYCSHFMINLEPCKNKRSRAVEEAKVDFFAGQSSRCKIIPTLLENGDPQMIGVV